MVHLGLVFLYEKRCLCLSFLRGTFKIRSHVWNPFLKPNTSKYYRNQTHYLYIHRCIIYTIPHWTNGVTYIYIYIPIFMHHCHVQNFLAPHSGRTILAEHRVSWNWSFRRCSDQRDKVGMRWCIQCVPWYLLRLVAGGFILVMVSLVWVGQKKIFTDFCWRKCCE